MQTAAFAQGAESLPTPQRLEVRAPTRPRHDERSDWLAIGAVYLAFMGAHLALLPFNASMGAAPAGPLEYALFGALTAVGPACILVSRFIPTEIRTGGADLEMRFGKRELKLGVLAGWRATQSRFGDRWHFTLTTAGGRRLRLWLLPTHVARALAADLAVRSTGGRSAALAGLPGDPGAAAPRPRRWPEPWAVTQRSGGQREADAAMREWQTPSPPLAALQWQTAPSARGRLLVVQLGGAAMLLPVAVAVAAAFRLGWPPAETAAAGALAAATTWAAVWAAMRQQYAGQVGVSRFGLPAGTSMARAVQIVEAAAARAGLTFSTHSANDFGQQWSQGEEMALLLQDRKVEHQLYLVLRSRGPARIASHQRFKGVIEEEARSRTQPA